MNLPRPYLPSLETIGSFYDHLVEHGIHDQSKAVRPDWVTTLTELPEELRTGRWMSLELHAGSLALCGASKSIDRVRTLMTRIEEPAAEEYINEFENSAPPEKATSNGSIFHLMISQLSHYTSPLNYHKSETPLD